MQWLGSGFMAIYKLADYDTMQRSAIMRVKRVPEEQFIIISIVKTIAGHKYS